MGENLTTTATVGNLASGSSIASTDTLRSIIKSMVWSDNPPEPSTEYESISIGTWASASDVNTFFTAHTPYNGWAGLKLGNYITINDGTYNTQWEIAGFNCEHNQTAADGTVYDNGYGICMIPKTQIPTTMTWNNSNTLSGAYKSSTMHTSHLVTVANNLRTILGDHLIQRNVLLSSSVDSNYYSNAYQWTTAYCTLMSIGQMTGTFASNRNKYDDGEANYKLPVFDHENYKTGSSFWSRCVWGYYKGYGYRAWSVYTGGSIYYDYVNGTSGVRPLIYLR